MRYLPHFYGHVTGNATIFLFGLIIAETKLEGYKNLIVNTHHLTTNVHMTMEGWGMGEDSAEVLFNL